MAKKPTDLKRVIEISIDETLIKTDSVAAAEQLREAQATLDNVRLSILKAAMKEFGAPGPFARALGEPPGVYRRAFRTAGIWAGERRPRGEAKPTAEKAKAKPQPKGEGKKAAKDVTPRPKQKEAKKAAPTVAAARRSTKTIAVKASAKKIANKRAGR